MNALVNRGAPRDFLDIHAVVEADLLTPARCWELWQAKNPGAAAARKHPRSRSFEDEADGH